MSTIYLAHQLIENSAQNSELLNVDWVIVPVANPDGYEYTHTHDRMWKKNRRIVTNNCVGVELNRLENIINFLKYFTKPFMFYSNFPFQYQAGASVRFSIDNLLFLLLRLFQNFSALPLSIQGQKRYLNLKPKHYLKPF